MAQLRAWSRLIVIITGTTILYVSYLIGYVLMNMLNRDHRNYRSFMVGKWAEFAILTLGIDLQVKGEPPEAPFFLVSNHLSYVDIIPYFALTDCIFVAKGELRSWPVLGFMAQTLGIIFVNRKTIRDIPRVNRLIAENITDNSGVVLFPEGTSSMGAEVLPFNSPLLHYAVYNNFPVNYATITYQTDIDNISLHKRVCWWGDMTLADHFFDLLKLESFTAIITFGEELIFEEDRKNLAAKLHQMVYDNFTPIVKNKEYV